jgi:ubiquinone/menaquinone biosynthesis C-methylase UbiE
MTRTATKYALGHAPTEIQRLVEQATILRPITTRLLKEAGIRSGMRVLDIGCGAGDVTMLAAELVGESGTVLGIDRSEAAIEAARARMASIRNVAFEIASPEELPDDQRFDMVIGRYVLIFQDDPASFVRASARLARSSGAIAFHEIDDADDYTAFPAAASWTQANDWVTRAFRHMFPSFDVPGRLVECFAKAGLDAPNLFCEVIAGDGERSPIPGWIAGAVRTLMPQIIEHGWASEEAIDIDNLEERLRAEAISAHSQLTAPRQVCAWLKLP